MYICRENNLLLLRMKTILLLGTLLLCGTFAVSTAQAGNASDVNGKHTVWQQRRTGSDIDRLVKQKYPGCRILDRDYDDGRLEVKIRHQGREKILIFDYDQRWERTVWELRREQLPKAVVRALAGIGFAFQYLDDNDNMAVDTPLGRFYAVQVDTDRRDGIYVVSERGRIAFRYTDDGTGNGNGKENGMKRNGTTAKTTSTKAMTSGIITVKNTNVARIGMTMKTRMMVKTTSTKGMTSGMTGGDSFRTLCSLLPCRCTRNGHPACP